MNVSNRPKVLIEEWLPIAVVGAESQRERGASSALPPLYFLHVWWARRPLTVSRAAILASVLPAWGGIPQRHFKDEDAYHAWFLHLIGIFGDPAAARRKLAEGRARGEFIANPYDYARAFTYNPSEDQIQTLRALLTETWGEERLSILDCFAGGGSIPFEAMRYGFDTFANELNPVACVILKATLEYPAKFGKHLKPLIEKYGAQMSEEIQRRLKPYFTEHPKSTDLIGACYLWARTVKCPYTGKPIPLSPNWWLLKGTDPVAVQPMFPADAEQATFRIVKGKDACAKVHPDKGTISRGDAVSPWAQFQAVDGDYIKAEAQAGRMGQQLYCVGLKKTGGFEFRAPSDEDVAAAALAEAETAKRWSDWEHRGLVPTERRRSGRADWAAEVYGMARWCDTYSNRQLLAFVTALEVLGDLRKRVTSELGPDTASPVLAYLALAMDKAIDYNSRQVQWDCTRVKIAHAFTRHDFGMKWSFAEFDAAHNLFPWVVNQVADAVGGIVALASSRTGLTSASLGSSLDRLHLSMGSAAFMAAIESDSVSAVVVDPPYYDNVNYADCSDYFYVWLKRSIGPEFPDWFREELTNKDDEAIANPARFEGVGRKRVELAERDYQRKMEACFREMRRVLRDHGVLSVMFTHKKVEAWDTLGAALINAGFSIHSSWPVHTESEHSLHQAKKNAAASTILLTCRKRAGKQESVWWDDLKNKVRETAREKAQAYEQAGIRGVDLYIATFGPVLSVISEHWPVLTSEQDERTGRPKPLRPETALEIAREEVIGLRRKGLLLGREVEFDALTDWYLMAWDAFKAEEFPADEGRKLAIALGLDMEQALVKAKKIVSKKSNRVVLAQPAGRRKKGAVDPEAETFDCLLDAAHTAMLVFDEDGGTTCAAWLRERGLDRDARMKALLQAMANAIPATRKKDGSYIRPEMDLLDRMSGALDLGLTLPAVSEPPGSVEQLEFDATSEEDGDENDDEEK